MRIRQRDADTDPELVVTSSYTGICSELDVIHIKLANHRLVMISSLTEVSLGTATSLRIHEGVEEHTL
jgi:hypothetical protein